MKEIFFNSTNLVAAAISGAFLGSLLMLVFAVPAMPEFWIWISDFNWFGWIELKEDQNWLVIIGILLGPIVAAFGFLLIYRQIAKQTVANNLISLPVFAEAMTFIVSDHRNLIRSINPLINFTADGAEILIKKFNQQELGWAEYAEATTIITKKLKGDLDASKFLSQEFYEFRDRIYRKVADLSNHDAGFFKPWYEDLQKRYSMFSDQIPTEERRKEILEIEAAAIVLFDRMKTPRRDKIVKEINDLVPMYEKMINDFGDHLKTKIFQAQNIIGLLPHQADSSDIVSGFGNSQHPPSQNST